MRILVLEDEQQLARHVVSALNRGGHVAHAEHEGHAGVRRALADRPDLVVLDLGLPGLDGFQVLTALRAGGCVARVLILTARGEVEHRVAGLRAGADDYLAKPFAMDELLARVEALGRRGTAPTAADLLAVADLRVDARHRTVARNGEPIELSPREFDLLLVLIQEPGRVFSRGEICERVWHREHDYHTRTVEIFIGRLRKKIDEHAVPLIHTIRSVGYTLRPPEQ
jgi:DNA-binding response OmpR family regulator